MDLHKLGWMPFFQATFSELDMEGIIPARVVQHHRERYVVASESGELDARVSGRLRHEAESRADFPAVGDWVAIIPSPGQGSAVIHRVLPRRGSFSRKAVSAGGPQYGPGKTDQQVLAANIDTVFLVSGLDGDFNLRRIERYVAVAWDSGGTPVIILNKADLRDDIDEIVERVGEVAIGIDIYAVSARDGEGLDIFDNYLTEGRTAVFLGSSGVGKSTIINRLIGEDVLNTNEVRADDSRGRHTTTHRELIVLPRGGLVIDTPGMREIQMWDDEEGLSRTFEDIEEMARQCRFNDCRHNEEPGCAVRQALEDGRLEPGRYGSYVKMQKEMKHLALRKDVAAQRRQHREWDKKIRNHFRQVKDLKKKGLM